MFGLPIWAFRLIGYGLLALTLIGCGLRLGYIWQHGQVVALQGQKAVAVAKQQQVSHVTQQITVASAAKETLAQSGLAAQAKIIKEKVRVYVHDPAPGLPVPCISWGMLRLHDAAVAGIDPGSLPVPAGQSDDACSPSTPSAFMGTVADNYAAARENAEQLDALEADINARIAALVAADGKAGDIAP